MHCSVFPSSQQAYQGVLFGQGPTQLDYGCLLGLYYSCGLPSHPMQLWLPPFPSPAIAEGLVLRDPWVVYCGVHQQGRRCRHIDRRWSQDVQGLSNVLLPRTLLLA